MRIGNNPNKDIVQQKSNYTHQVIIPVYIPNQEGYFKDAFRIFDLCLTSLFETTHHKTYITIINNGSCKEVKAYLETLFLQGNIQELLHTSNIGKFNAILKGLVGNDMELVTISDADVMFLSNWQVETVKIFEQLPKAGVVGLTPQFKMFESHCGNLICDNLFNKKLRFISVKNKEALIRFYDSLGWKRDYNQDHLNHVLGLKISPNFKVLIGSGHFVATYKKDVFKNITSFSEYKLGGDSEIYIDKLPLKKDYWRLTTYDNFAYHMGNTYENWMSEIKFNSLEKDLQTNFKIRNANSHFSYFIKNRLLPKIIFNKNIIILFFIWKKLPKNIAKNYHNFK